MERKAPLPRKPILSRHSLLVILYCPNSVISREQIIPPVKNIASSESGCLIDSRILKLERSIESVDARFGDFDLSLVEKDFNKATDKIEKLEEQRKKMARALGLLFGWVTPEQYV